MELEKAPVLLTFVMTNKDEIEIDCGDEDGRKALLQRFFNNNNEREPWGFFKAIFHGNTIHIRRAHVAYVTEG